MRLHLEGGGIFGMHVPEIGVKAWGPPQQHRDGAHAEGEGETQDEGRGPEGVGEQERNPQRTRWMAPRRRGEAHEQGC